MRHPSRKCDGSFTLEEFRRVGELKKSEKQKRLAKAKQISALRKTLLSARKALAEAQAALSAVESELVGAEEEQNALDETIAALDSKAEGMLRREMRVLGVLDSLLDD